ncbi:MAG: hypothetical protein A2Y82_04205 [Candidatus Buchananbacteria bacterium RBG_13_36_9]|uniref:Uncharacterized protein n=1 Tax=Candidatus Buchananbacteria bacterium RBG_13_36_9 TaxID=1797530 RepID=A0A1G1XSD7_9BACT|nr:MAG: hypothetical protein A2Y82_04205 [Candidatus Buchananbacteria bacterium RBG_13_36_9]
MIAIQVKVGVVPLLSDGIASKILLIPAGLKYIKAVPPTIIVMQGVVNQYLCQFQHSMFLLRKCLTGKHTPCFGLIPVPLTICW